MIITRLTGVERPAKIYVFNFPLSGEYATLNWDNDQYDGGQYCVAIFKIKWHEKKSK